MAKLDWITARPISHRGLHDAASGIVENTASAFTAAIDNGYAIETDLQISANGEAMVHHDDALGRLEQGTYGTCERCGARLGDELLGSDPLAARCGEHCAAADPGDHTDVQAAPVPPAP